MQMRTCNTCGRTLSEDQFSKNGRWYRNKCLECHRAYCSENYKKHRKTRIAHVAEYYKEHREERLEYGKAHYRSNKPKYRKHGAKGRERLRDQVFEAYGGKCECCGETERMFLTIDHVDGNGNKHRREVLGGFNRAGTATYAWLRKQGFPKGFQVLCYNCNVGKHRNNGICPHKARPKE